MKSKLTVIVVLAVVVGLLLPAEALAEFDNLPPEFDDKPVADGLGQPTAFDWLPNGDLLIAAQDGTVYLQSGADPVQEVLDLNDGSDGICSFDVANEMGLLGLAVDPDFGNEPGHIFLYYTDRKADGRCANRVSRFTIDESGSIGNERVLIDNIPAPGGNHNGGDLQFDRNGLLYISVGDGGQDLRDPERTQEENRNARRLDILNGKILRIQRDGDIPSGNPFTGSGTRRCSGSPVLESQGKSVTAEKKSHRKKKKKRRRQRRRNRSGPVCQEIFATGLRNPFRIAFDPNDDSGAQRFFINDVGTGAWEEIDEGQAGADYGWNIREGPCQVGSVTNCAPDNRFEQPVFAYRLVNQIDPFVGCRTITGGAFVPDDAGWPEELDGDYLFADFRCGRIFILTDEAPGEPTEVFASGLPLFAGPTLLAFGPAPEFALYYATFDGGGQVRKIVFSSPN